MGKPTIGEATKEAKLPGVNAQNGYDPADNMYMTKSVQKRFRDNFTGAALDTTKWDSVVASGASIVVGGNTVQMASGTTANGETYLLSKEDFTIPVHMAAGIALSQRIANQTFIFELVSVDPETGLPDGKNSMGWAFDNTTVTSGKIRTQVGGISPIDVANTILSTATASVFELEPNTDDQQYHNVVMDSNNVRAYSYKRHTLVVDPNAVYKIRLRWLNGGTAPASSTTATISYVALMDNAEITAEIVGSRGNTAPGQSLPVNIVQSTGTVYTAGSGAHDGAASTLNPIKIGAQAQNAVPAAVSANNDLTNIIATMLGVPIVRPFSLPEGDWQFTAGSPLTTTADTVAKAAAGAAARNYVTAIQLRNTSATGTEVAIKDGATTIWKMWLTNTDVVTVEFPTPLRGSLNTAINIACGTAGANVYVSAQGYSAP